MVDRQLVVEFPFLNVTVKEGELDWDLFPTDTRLAANGIYIQEQKLDFSGYVQSDLTVGFRRSFEQSGAADSINWDTYDANTDIVFETVIISSVPFNDDQLLQAIVTAPGFTPLNNPFFDQGNFNRTHIIHGSAKIYYPNSIMGSGSFTAAGNATLTPLVDNYFSSLEPTAADCLYCYRVFSFPGAGLTQLTAITLSPRRVILDAFTVEEPDLEYMMRLKRSYELANQV
jgi:hypothetical protein